jgi:hypothetical protein
MALGSQIPSFVHFSVYSIDYASIAWRLAKNRPFGLHKCETFQVFSHLNKEIFTAFLAKMAPDVERTIVGTHPLAGVRHSQKLLVANAIQRVGNVLATSGSTISFRLLEVGLRSGVCRRSMH